MLTITEPGALPDGEYAIVEILGHQTLVGRIAEVERFGTKMLCIEPLYAAWMLDPIWQSGASLYRVTPCSPAVAWKERPTSAWSLPDAVRASMPRHLLPPPDVEAEAEQIEDHIEGDDDEEIQF